MSNQPDRKRARKVLAWLNEVNLDTALMRERAIDRGTDAMLEFAAELTTSINGRPLDRAAELRAQKSDAGKESK